MLLSTEFRKQFAFFKKHRVQILGISTDTVESHARFKKSLSLPFSLLADTEAKVIRLYDAFMEHKGLTLAARKIVLIDQTGRIVYRDDKYDLSTDDDLNRLKTAVQKLK